MHRHLKIRYLIPALFALGLMFYAAIVSTRNTRANLSDFQWVVHTRGLLMDIKNLREITHGMVISQRGYILTGHKHYLTTLEKQKSSLQESLQRLIEHSGDNIQQQQRLHQIRDLLENLSQQLEDGIQERKSQGMEASVQLIAAGKSRDLLARLSTRFNEIESAELDLMQQREIKMRQSLRDTNVTILAANAIAVLTGTIGTILLGLFLMAQDREEKLQYEKDKAVQADRAKSEFLAMMSHEIRTPMNAILGFGELLHASATRPEDRHYAQAILTSGHSLLTLINDILDLSKIEAAKLAIMPEEIEVRRFIEQIQTLFSYRAEEKGLKFRIETDPSVPEFLRFDALRVRQVLINLIGNAIKFTEDGSVRVKLWCSSDHPENHTCLHFQVIDTGIGICKEQQSQIFRPFYQVEQICDRTYQGTGLGLSISERLTRLMGGTIDVSSRLGLGSSFHVQFPVQPGCETVSPQAEAETSSPDSTISLAIASQASIRDQPELIEKLRHLHHSVWPNLVSLVPAQGTINFSRQLASLATIHNSQVLGAYARHLGEAANTMDFQEAGHILGQFPALIDQLSTSHV
ncbi:MAG: ATP-binding protein [Luteolibacter sp.]